MIRGKRPEADLKRSYNKVLGICMFLSALLQAATFALFPRLEAKAYARPQKQVVIQLEKIPETRQDRAAAPPPRPAVPIASASDQVSEEETIESTELDLHQVDLPPPPPLPESTAIRQETKLVEAEEEEVVELWKVEKAPEVRKKLVPEYPEIARKAGIEGKVFVYVLVGRNGKVEQLGEITGPEVFHEAAQAAALQWEFTPAIQNDKPVRVWVSLPFTFQLK
jgi:protein TonB